MVDPKKLKNILKYSSFIEILNNSNIIFAKDNEKQSTGCCNFTKKDDKNKKKEEENQKPIQTPVQTPNEDNSELLKECQDLLKEIQNLDNNYNVDFSQYTSKEQLTNLKNQLTAKLAELKEKDKDTKGKDKNPEDHKGKVDISKITVKEYVDKIDADKSDHNLSVDTLKEHINIIKAKFDEYKKRLDEIIKTNLAGFDYDNALKILKEYKNIISDMNSALLFPHFNQYSVFKDFEEDSIERKFVSEIRLTVGDIRENYVNIDKTLNSIIEKHDAEKLKKEVAEKDHKNYVDKLSSKLPVGYKFKSKGSNYHIDLVDSKDENIKYGKYSFYGGGSIYLYDFDFYIKLEDFIFFAKIASKLGIDEDFAKDRRLLACHFSSRVPNADNLILLIDLTNKDIFTKYKDFIYYLGYNEYKACLTEGGQYFKDNYPDNKGKGLKYKGHIEINKFDYEYLNSPIILYSNNEVFK